MDVLKLQIPFEFIRSRALLSWSDVAFGLDQQLLDEAAPSELATERLAEDLGSGSDMIDLLEASPQVNALPIVKKLASRELGVSPDAIREKWLFLVLSWILENQDRFSDPLEMVEVVYADFGYPVSIAPFVRYMPSSESRLGSPVFERARLFGIWRSYIEEGARRFNPARASPG